MNEEEKKTIEDIKRELSDEDRKEYMSSWFAKDLDIAVNLIEKLQKENEDLKADNYELNNRITDLLENIPVQKIKDKIEELNQYYKKEIYPNLYQWCDITITEHYDEMIELLQELIEEREEKIK